jgi:hypothetical protein
MPQLIPLVPALLTAGSSIAGGLANRSKTSTATQTPTFTPEQTGLQTTLAGTLQDRLANPVNLNPQKVAAFGNVNKTYQGVEDRLTQRLAGQGFGQSGKVGTNLKQLEIARAGDIGATEDRYSGMQINQNNRTLEQALQFAFDKPGVSGTSTTPGNVLGGAVGGGLETATLMYALSHFLNGGGGGMGSAGASEEGY